MNLFSKHSSLEKQNSKLVEQVGDLSIRLEQEHNFFNEEKQKTARLEKENAELREIANDRGNKIVSLINESLYMKSYGSIDFLGSNGKVGETMYFKTKEEFDKEVHDSYEIGRPIITNVREEENELER